MDSFRSWILKRFACETLIGLVIKLDGLLNRQK